MWSYLRLYMVKQWFQRYIGLSLQYFFYVLPLGFCILVWIFELKPSTSEYPPKSIIYLSG